MKLPSLRLGAVSLAAGSALVIAGRLLMRRAGARPALPAPASAGADYGRLPPVLVAAEPVAKIFPAPSTSAEHVPTDLLGDQPPAPGERAPDAFRPDLTAPVPAAEREALRPAPPLESAAKAVADSERAEAF